MIETVSATTELTATVADFQVLESATPIVPVGDSGDSVLAAIRSEADDIVSSQVSTAIVSTTDVVKASAATARAAALSAAAASSAVVATIPLGDNFEYGGDLAVSPDGSRVYVVGYSNADDDALVVIDTATNTVAATIDVESYPVGVVVSPDGKRLYVSHSSVGMLSVVDTATNTVTGTISLNDGALDVTNGGALAVSPDGTRVYVTGWQPLSDPYDGHGTYVIAVVDTTSDTVTARIFVPGNEVLGPNGVWYVNGGAPLGVAVSPDGSRVYVGVDGIEGNAGVPLTVGSLTVIDTASNSVIDTVSIGHPRVRVAAVSPDGSGVYIISEAWRSDAGAVSVWDTATGAFSNIAAIDAPHSLAVSPDGSRVYISSRNNIVSAIDAATNTVISAATIDNPGVLAVSPDGSRVYDLNWHANGLDPTLSVIDAGQLATDTELDPLSALALAFNNGLLSFRDFSNMLANTFSGWVNGVVSSIRESLPTGGSGQVRIDTPTTTVGLWNRLLTVTGGFFNDGFYIDKVKSADDGQAKLVVYIGGTDPFSPFNQPALQNSVGWTGQAQYWQVSQIEAARGGNPNIEIMLVGFSQGGMDAQNLAAHADDLGLNVTTVVTFGSPVVQDAPTDTDGYQVVHLEAKKDPVPDWGRPGERSAARKAKILFEGTTATSNNFWANVNGLGVVHGDPATYRELAQQFDTSQQFKTIKANIDGFEGQYLGHY